MKIQSLSPIRTKSLLSLFSHCLLMAFLVACASKPCVIVLKENEVLARENEHILELAYRVKASGGRDVSLRDLVALNNLKSPRLKKNQVIVLPGPLQSATRENLAQRSASSTDIHNVWGNAKSFDHEGAPRKPSTSRKTPSPEETWDSESQGSQEVAIWNAEGEAPYNPEAPQGELGNPQRGGGEDLHDRPKNTLSQEESTGPAQDVPQDLFSDTGKDKGLDSQDMPRVRNVGAISESSAPREDFAQSFNIKSPLPQEEQRDEDRGWQRTIQPPAPAKGAPKKGRVGVKGVTMAGEPLRQSQRQNESRAPASFQNPVPGPAIRHFEADVFSGTLLKAKKGSNICAPGAGNVIFVGEVDPTQGSIVIIDHGKDIHSVTSGYKKFFIDKDAQVKKGQPLGMVDERKKGVYLEFRKNREPVDPRTFTGKPPKGTSAQKKSL